MSKRETRRELAARTLAELDLTNTDGFVVDTTPGKVVFSTRIPAEYSEPLAAEATRRGLTPSALICELVVDGLRKVNEEKDEVVTLRRGDLHRVIDEVLRKVA